MMRSVCSLLMFIIVFMGGCSVQHMEVKLDEDKNLFAASEDSATQKKITRLQQLLQSLSHDVDETEAKMLSQAAVLYPFYLAERYALVSPPYFHNFLITVGLRERGLCYHWAGDMMEYLKEYRFKSFDLYRAVVEQGNLREHHSIVITAKGEPFSEGIVLDAWRGSSDIYFEKVKDDKEYDWIPNRVYRVIRG